MHLLENPKEGSFGVTQQLKPSSRGTAQRSSVFRQFGEPIRPSGGTFVYAALAFYKLPKALGIWLESLAISKCSRPFASSLCVHLKRIGGAENNNAKRLKVSDPSSSPECPKRLMRARLSPMLVSPPTHYFKNRSQVIVNCIAFAG